MKISRATYDPDLLPPELPQLGETLIVSEAPGLGSVFDLIITRPKVFHGVYVIQVRRVNYQTKRYESLSVGDGWPPRPAYMPPGEFIQASFDWDDVLRLAVHQVIRTSPAREALLKFADSYPDFDQRAPVEANLIREWPQDALSSLMGRVLANPTGPRYDLLQLILP